jgi:hypothetical protein
MHYASSTLSHALSHLPQSTGDQVTQGDVVAQQRCYGSVWDLVAHRVSSETRFASCFARLDAKRV